MEPVHKKRDWRKEGKKRREKREKTNAKLRRIIERKRRRRPSQWGPEEKSNPDFQWLGFLKMVDELDAEAKKRHLLNVAAYLKMSHKYKQSPEEPLNRAERKRMLSAIGEYMAAEKKVPDLWWLKRKYKELKKK